MPRTVRRASATRIFSRHYFFRYHTVGNMRKKYDLLVPRNSCSNATLHNAATYSCYYLRYGTYGMAWKLVNCS